MKQPEQLAPADWLNLISARSFLERFEHSSRTLKNEPSAVAAGEKILCKSIKKKRKNFLRIFSNFCD